MQADFSLPRRRFPRHESVNADSVGIRCRRATASAGLVLGVLVAGWLPGVSDWLCPPATAVAQEGPTEPRWNVVRTTAFALVDRQTTEKWLEAQVDALLGADTVFAVQRDGKALYEKLREHYEARDASPEFRDGLADLLTSIFVARYEAGETFAEPPKPLAVTYVLMTLRDFANPAGRLAFRAALEDLTPGPRMLAAEGLAAIRQDLSDDQWSTILADVQNLATREDHPVVLSRLYRVLEVEAGRTESGLSALMEILTRRFIRFEQQGAKPLLADTEATGWLAGQAVQTGNATTQNEAIRRAARLMADAVYEYLQLLDQPGVKPASAEGAELTEAGAASTSRRRREQQEVYERIVLAAEKQLVSLVRARASSVQLPRPPLSDRMLSGDPDRGAKMAETLNAWIGGGGEVGVLNASPFNLPAGLAIERRTPPAAQGAGDAS